MPELTLRPAVPEDAPVLARIQTEAWNAAFGGILSPEVWPRPRSWKRLKRCMHMC